MLHLLQTLLCEENKIALAGPYNFVFYIYMQAEALVKAQDGYRETTGHLGMTLIKLAKFEREQATCNSLRRRSGEIHNFANSVLKMSRSQIKLNSEIVKHLVC
jgi:hypothetical protein